MREQKAALRSGKGVWNMMRFKEEEGTIKFFSPMVMLLLMDEHVRNVILSQWLGWQDLSVLDTTCLGRCRKHWLVAISKLTMSSAMIARRIPSDKNMIIFYNWLASRQVFLTKNFPVRLSLLDDLLRFDHSSSSAIRSVSISRDSIKSSTDLISIEHGLSAWLGRCPNLRGVTVYGLCAEPSMVIELDRALLCALSDHIECNTLSRICFFFQSPDPPLEELIILMARHVQTLKNFEVYSASGDQHRIKDLMTFLCHGAFRLEKLCLSIPCESQTLLTSLSGVGKHLRTLEVNNYGQYVITDELLSDLGVACPNLRALTVRNAACDEVAEPSRLFELCPELRSLSLVEGNSISVDDRKRQVKIELNNGLTTMEEREDWLTWLGTFLPKNQYLLASSNKWFCTDLIYEWYEWNLLKTTLKGYLTHIEATMSEDILIDLLRELSHVESLTILHNRRVEFTDASLTAIIQHGSHLKKLRVGSVNTLSGYHFTDEMIAKVIVSCKNLEYLMIPCAGCHSLLALAKHQMLKEVVLYCATAEDATLDEILFKENLAWPPSLRIGMIRRSEAHFDFMPLSHSWSESDSLY
eukprot:scaffold2237_cov175-Ochromonas_danica.AAC.7